MRKGRPAVISGRAGAEGAFPQDHLAWYRDDPGLLPAATALAPCSARVARGSARTRLAAISPIA